MDLSILAKTVKTEELRCNEQSCAYVKKSLEHSCDDSALLIIRDDYVLIGVFDGVSGEANASTASETALKTIANYIEKFFTKKSTKELLEEAISEANYAIQAGGTTASIALILKDGNYFYANLGDSHIYKISKQRVVRLTKDDRDASSFANYIKHRMHVTQCIGGLLSKIDAGKGKLESGDVLFAITDGVIDNLFIKVEGGIVTDTSGKQDLERILYEKKDIKAIIEALTEEIKKRMQLKEEVIDNGILVPKEDDASIVFFRY